MNIDLDRFWKSDIILSLASKAQLKRHDLTNEKELNYILVYYFILKSIYSYRKSYIIKEDMNIEHNGLVISCLVTVS